MAYELETIKLSQKIYHYLICNGSLPEYKAPELFRAYVEQEEVMNLVKSQGEIAECSIERFGSTIYLMPEVSNNYLGYTKTELKKELCKSNGTDKDYYLSQFVVLTLLAEFFDGQGSRSKSRDFIKMGEFQNVVSDRLQSGLQREKEQEQVEVAETGLDYKSMCEAFEALKSADISNRSKTTKEGFLNNIMDFLENQGLIIYIKEDDMIKTTQKLDNIMEMKLLNKNNYRKMMEALGVEADE